MFFIFCNLLLLRILDQALSTLLCRSWPHRHTDAALLKCTGVLDPFGGCGAARSGFVSFGVWDTLKPQNVAGQHFGTFGAREAVSPRILGPGVP